MTHSRSLVFIIGAMIFSSIFLHGCGANPTSTATPATTTITGIVLGATQVSGEIMAIVYNGASSTSADILADHYYYSSHTFEVLEVPTNSTVYLFAELFDASRTAGSYAHAYKRITVGTDPMSIVVTLESQVTIDATCTLPGGYTMAGYNVYLSRDGHLINFITGGDTASTTFNMGILPTLEANDYFMVYMHAKNATGDYLNMFYYDVVDGASTFDMTTLPVPSTSFLLFPPDGTTFTSTPTFEWEPLSWADYYTIRIYTGGMLDITWESSTTEATISIPASVLSSMGSGTFRWDVRAFKTSTREADLFSSRDSLPAFIIP